MPKKKQSKPSKRRSGPTLPDLSKRLDQLEADFDELRRHTKNVIHAIVREATVVPESSHENL